MSINQIEARQEFDRLHPTMRWRLFIDGYRHDEGSNAFDVREPGYMRAMNTAYEYMLGTFDEPLTSSLIADLNEVALKGVDQTDNEHAGKFRHDTPGDFGLMIVGSDADPKRRLAGNTTLAGLTEFKQQTALLNEKVLSSQGKLRDRFAMYAAGENDNLLQKKLQKKYLKTLGQRTFILLWRKKTVHN